jgi:potassium-dependent mechanosensitive channel
MRIPALFIALIALALFNDSVQAQTIVEKDKIAITRQQLDLISQRLNHSEQDINAPDVSEAKLLGLKSNIETLTGDVQNIIDDMSSRLETLQNRLEQLGPPPSDKNIPEDKTLSRQRDDLTEQVQSTDALLKRAKLITVEIDQTLENISIHRRQIFSHALFGHSSSIIAPSLWINVIKNIPYEWRSLSFALNNYYQQNILNRSASDIRIFISLLIISFIYFATAFVLVNHFFNQYQLRYIEPQRLNLLWFSLCKISALIFIPVSASLILISILNNYDLVSEHNALTAEFFNSTLRLSITNALLNGLLAPNQNKWRLISIDNYTAELLSHYVMNFIIFITGARLIESIFDLIAVSLSITIALKGLIALISAFILLKSLKKLSAQFEQDDCLGPRITDHRQYEVFIKMSLWLITITLGAASLFGYIAFSSFLIDQLIWIGMLAALLFCALEFNDKVVIRTLTPSAFLGRVMMSSLGIKRESLDLITIILSGISTLIFVLIFALFALAPWGIESDGMVGTIKAAFFGFRFGDITISLSDIVIALILFILALLITRTFQNWLEKSFLPHTQLDIGLRNSIKTSLGYIGFFTAASLALVHLGLNFEKLALVAGALSVGIGFGLQSIVNNFVSGLILLWERAIRVGDWIVVGDEQGYVKRINVRSTEIETFDRATMIVPNANLVSGTVKNWVRTDRIGRIKVLLSVGIHTNPDQVRELLLACANEHDLVLKVPAPQVIFTAMADSGLKFELVCFVSEVEASSRTKSDLHFDIFRRFKAAGLEILTGGPPAPTRITIEGLHEIMERTSR